MKVFPVLAAALLAAAGLRAQSELATLTGTVTDATGAVLIEVTVTAVHEATGLSSTAVTNDSGRYSIPSLKPGVYTVSAVLRGFKKLVNSGVTLQVNQTARLDLVLALGEVNEQVTVTSEAPLLESETSNRGAVIDQRKILELPLNGRDYNQLALLSPGVLAPTPRLQGIGFKGAFNVNGNRAFQNGFLLDGVDNTSYSNSFRGNNMQVVQPSVEALQEFKIQTNAYAAEFGRSAGALVNAVIKSGANALHGSAYEFHRSRAFDANNFFANRAGADKPFRLRNQFGATAGGPIVRNKTFFFGDYEGLRDRAGTVRITSVPQTIWKRGLFTMPIHNPFSPSDTGQDFRVPAAPECDDGKGNCWAIPRNLIDPVGQRIVNVNPDPNTGKPGDIDNNFVNVPTDRNRTDQFDVRVDHSLTSALNLFGRYSFADTTAFKPGPRPGLSDGSGNDMFGSAEWRSQAIAAGATWTLSPQLVTELRFGYSRGNYFQTPQNFGSGCPEALVGLKNAPGDQSICGGLPVIDIIGGKLRRIGRTTSTPQFQTPRSWDTRGSAALMLGNHALKLGGEFLHLSTGIRDVSALLGRFDFSGRFTGQNGQYQGAIADLLLGFPTRYRQDSNTVFHQWQRMYDLYIQDDWKVSSRLTLNYGLRYEFATPPRERDNQWANFDPAAQKFVQARAGSLFDQALIRPDRNNFAPRFGFALSLFRGTVLRGAYGVFYHHTSRQGREGLMGFNPPFIILADSRVAGSGTAKASNAIFRLQDGIPPGFVDLKQVNLATAGRKAQQMDQRTTYIQQWNLGIQREIARDLLLDVAYVGNAGTKLPAFRNLNQRLWSFDAAGTPVAGARPLAAAGLNGDIQYQENAGISNYHSLQARLEKRFSRGLSGLVSYTWGKALTNAVDHLSTTGEGNGVDVGVFKEPQNGAERRAEYGLAEFDVQHRLAASAVWLIPYTRGWEFSPIVTVQSGLGLTVTQSQYLDLGGERISRPNRIRSGTLAQRTVDRYFDTAAFQVLRPGSVPYETFGNSGVGILRGPGLFNVDFNLSKTFAIGERRSLQFRAELFNALNRANFSVPGINMEAGFGQIVNTATEARIIQFALKYRF